MFIVQTKIFKVQTAIILATMCKSTNSNDQVAPAPNKQQKHPLRDDCGDLLTRPQQTHVRAADRRTNAQGEARARTGHHDNSLGVLRATRTHDHVYVTVALYREAGRAQHSTRRRYRRHWHCTGGWRRGKRARTLPHARAPHPLIVINWRAGSPAARVMPPVLSPHFVSFLVVYNSNEYSYYNKYRPYGQVSDQMWS